MTGATTCTNLINCCRAGNEFGCGKEGMVDSLSVHVYIYPQLLYVACLKRETFNLVCKSILVCVHCRPSFE